jgi:hypothetical protein
MTTLQILERVAAVMTAAVPFMMVLGAVLPAQSRLGQAIRRWFPDVANKNLRTTAPMAPMAPTPAPEEKK